MKLSDDIPARAAKTFLRALVRYNKAAKLVELADAEFRKDWGILEQGDRSILRAARRTICDEDNEP